MKERGRTRSCPLGFHAGFLAAPLDQGLVLRGSRAVSPVGETPEEPERQGNQGRRGEEQSEAPFLRQRGRGHDSYPALGEQGGGKERDNRGACLRHHLGGPGLQRGVHGDQTPPTSTAATPAPASNRLPVPKA